MAVDFHDIVFHKARTHTVWQEKPVADDLLQEIYNLAKLGPTSANCCPMRVVFVKSPEAKAKLKPTLDEGNVTKTMTAPVTAIFAYDLDFYEHMPFLFPHADAKSWFEGKEEVIKTTAFRNGTLQAAYFMVAARSLGLDCGPMSGFDNAKLDEAFFQGTNYKSNFLCNLGYGVEEALFPRSPRFEFDQVCDIQ